MDDVKRMLLLLTLLAAFPGAGCSLGTRPSKELPSRSAFHAPDPWKTGLEPPESAPPEMRSASETESPAAAEAETGAGSRMTLADQETILASNCWVRNIELARREDKDRHGPEPRRDVARLKRRAEINRLNMSEAEAKKKAALVYDYSPGLLSAWRWYHKGIEELASIPTEQRHSPETFLPPLDSFLHDKPKRLLQANAAVLSGRDGDVHARPYLLAVVRDGNLKVEVRCAAVETLGFLPNVTEDDLLSLLEFGRGSNPDDVDITKKASGLSKRPMIQALWTELLTVLAEKIEPWEHPCFLEPLESRSAAMRAAALKIWRLHAPVASPESETERPELPEAFLEYARKETDATLRMEIIRTLGAWKDPDILALVRPDLSKNAILANVAMDALAEAGCTDAVPVIKEKLRNPIGKNRAKAAESLRKLDCLDDVFRLKDDKDREVRAEVAKALAGRCTPPTIELAKNYLDDAGVVQEETVQAVANWPIEQAGTLFLEALKSRHPNVRLRAGTLLAEYLEEAAQYDVLESPDRQLERHAELVRCFERFLAARRDDLPDAGRDEVSRPTAGKDSKPFDSTDPTLLEVRRCLDDWNRPGIPYRERRVLTERLLSLGDRLMSVLHHLYEIERRKIPTSLDRPVLSKIDPLFAVIVQLDADDVAQRRQAAEELLRRSRTHEFGKLAADRILLRAERQNSVPVQGVLLETLAGADGETARNYALTLLDSESAELRRRACETLGRSGNRRDLETLAGMLHDPNRDVVRGVLESIASIGGRPELDPKTPNPDGVLSAIESLLLQHDPLLQADAAATLHVLGHPAGAETLQRLSLSPDRKVKSYVARTVVASGDPVFAPILLRFLDDDAHLARTALDGLPKLVGRDVGLIDNKELQTGENLSPSQLKIARWKYWAASSRLDVDRRSTPER